MKELLLSISTRYYETAKRFLAGYVLLRLSIYVLGVLVISFSIISEIAPFIIVGLTILSEISMFASDIKKGTAESIRRKLDAADSLGWPISKVEISDLLVNTPARYTDRLIKAGDESEWFASTESIGVQRALENIQESAWWSKHLSGAMWVYCLSALLALVAASITALIVSVYTIQDYAALKSIGRVVTATLMLTLSLGLFRFIFGYHTFSQKASHIEERIESLFSIPNLAEIDAIKVMNEYNLARAAAPLLPEQLGSSSGVNSMTFGNRIGNARHT